jgi:hypothetical protein
LKLRILKEGSENFTKREGIAITATSLSIQLWSENHSENPTFPVMQRSFNKNCIEGDKEFANNRKEVIEDCLLLDPLACGQIKREKVE